MVPRSPSDQGGLQKRRCGRGYRGDPDDVGRLRASQRTDGLKFWPERAMGRDPAVNTAEVDAALAKPIPQSTPMSTSSWPISPTPKLLSYRELAALWGVSPAAA